MDRHLFECTVKAVPIRDATPWRVSTIFLCVSLFVSSHFQAASLSQKPLRLLLDFTYFFPHWFCYSSPTTKLLFILLWFCFFFWPSPLLLPLLLTFVLLFLFCFSSFLLPANDNQHTDGKPVPVSLSLSSLPIVSVSNFLSGPVTAWYQTTHRHRSSHVQLIVLAVDTPTVGFCVVNHAHVSRC